MEVEIIFSGLCSFLNIPDEDGNIDDKIVGPSVILVQTDKCGAIDCATMHDPDKDDDQGRRMHDHHDDGDAARDVDIEGEADTAGNGGGDIHKSHRHIP